MKNKIMLLVFVLCSHLAISQSIEIIAKDSIEDIAKIDMKKALIFSKNKARFHLKKNELDKAIFFANKGLDVAKNESDYLNIISFNGLIAQLYFRNDEKNEAKKFLYNSIDILKTDYKDSLNLAKTYINLGNVLDSASEYIESIEIALKANQLLEKLNKNNFKLYTLNNLGVLYQKINDEENALKYFNELYELSIKLNDSSFMSKAKKNKAITYKSLKDYKKSISLGKEVVIYEENKKNYRGLGLTYNTIGQNYIHLKKYDSAKYFLQKSLTLKKKFGSKRDLLSSNINLGKLYLKLDKPLISLNFLNDALKQEKEIDSPYHLKILFQLLSEANYASKNYKKAYDYLLKNRAVVDSIEGSILNIK